MAEKKNKKTKTVVTPKFKLEKENYYIMGAGALSVLLGFFTLSKGMVDLPAILLVLGYCVLLPAGILWKKKES